MFWFIISGTLRFCAIVRKSPLESLSIIGVRVIGVPCSVQVSFVIPRLYHTVLGLSQTLHCLAVIVRLLGVRLIGMFTIDHHIITDLIRWFSFRCIQIPGLVERLGLRLKIWSRGTWTRLLLLRCRFYNRMRQSALAERQTVVVQACDGPVPALITLVDLDRHYHLS